MTLSEFYKTYSSDCTAGSANQVLTRFAKPVTKTGRCYFRLSHGGDNYALLFSNQIDSTFDDGSISKANDIGGVWHIDAMRVGLCARRGEDPSRWHTVTFDGSPCKTVSGSEPFVTDPIPLHAAAGESLCYEITLTGACFPYHDEIVLTVTSKTESGFVPDRQVPVPLMIGSDRPISRRIGFIGDSITQGCATEFDSYTHWVAQIAAKLPPQYSVWNLGIGFARAYDAATDCGWLARVKQCDTVHVCFGVNDLLRGRTAQQVLGDLSTIVQALKKAGCRVILLTVPPFDLTGIQKEYWYAVNEAIRSTLCAEADALFDFAAILGQPEPYAHRSVYGGHPNAQGCQMVAEAYPAQLLL